MPSMAEKLWDLGKSPPQHFMLIAFGLVALLTAIIVRSINGFLLGFGLSTLGFVAAVLGGVGAFFVTFALFLGAYAGSDNNGAAWKIAQLIGAVVVLVLLLF